MNVRWLRDTRIEERMHAQGLPLDMMLSVDRGSDVVTLRVTTRHLTREEARELGSRLIEAALLAGEREISEERIVLHGHVKPRPDGMRARCGGPALCDQCRREANGEL